jgi:hypothetical protein
VRYRPSAHHRATKPYTESQVCLLVRLAWVILVGNKNVFDVPPLQVPHGQRCGSLSLLPEQAVPRQKDVLLILLSRKDACWL